MRKRVLIALFVLAWVVVPAIVYQSRDSGSETSRTPREQTSARQAPVESDCKPHVELLSAEELAREYGKETMWILNNVKINLWEKTTPQGKGRRVGEMLPGSRAVIVEQATEDYKVQSPLDNSVGWVNKLQVSRTLRQNVKTRLPCE